MKTIFNYFLFSILILSLFSCAPTKKLRKGYFQSTERIGIVIYENDFAIIKKLALGGASPAQLALSIGFSKLLNRTEPQHEREVARAIQKRHPKLKEQILKLFVSEHERNNLNYEIIDIDLDTMQLKEHDKSFIKRKQAILDYRGIGKEYNLDYLLIIDVKNYLVLQGLKKYLYFGVMPMVISMEDNSFFYRDNFKIESLMLAKWRQEPDYRNLMKRNNNQIMNVLHEVKNSLR